MKLENNTIVITGGSSGIGREMAKRLSVNNTVLICGRSLDKLEATKKEIKNIEIFQCDVSYQEECKRLACWVEEKYPSCNILINNAAIVHVIGFREDKDAIAKADAEIRTNLMAPIVLSKLFLPILEKNKNAKLINVTTGLVYVPRAIYPFYNATKAGLHSFTQTLRLQLKNSSVSIVEVMFPVVDTLWHKGNVPKIAISVDSAVSEMIRGIEKGLFEIKIGKVKLLHKITRISPAFALKKINEVE